MLKQLARITYRHRRITVVAWVAILVAAIVVGPQIKGDWSNKDRLDGADSQAAYDLLQSHMPAQNNNSDVIVLDRIPGHDAAINTFLDKARGMQDIESVSPLTVSQDGTAALVTVTFKDDVDDFVSPAIKQLKDAGAELDKSGVQTSFAGYAFNDSSSPNSEVIGIVAALAILVFAFGSVVAAGLPILVAVFGVVIGGAIVGILARFMGMGEVTQIVGSMISVGVGIDYTLLIVSRYRSALVRLGDPEAAVIDAMDHAGRAVLLAGAIVAVALMGLLTIGMATFTGLAVGAAAAVLIAVIATLTFTPALLGFIGNNINRLHIGRKSRQRKIAATHESSRWAEIVQRRPKLFAISGIAALLVMAIPMTSLTLGTADSTATAPPDSTNRVAYDVVSRAFGPGFHGPILVVVDNPSASGLATLTAKLRNTPGIVSVGEPTMSPDNAIATFDAVPSTAPDSRATVSLLKHLRKDVIPPAEGNMRAHLGGDTALDIDFAERCGSRLPWFVGVVLLLSFLMLMTTFRSVVIPLKAVLLNLLSLSAAGGLLVAMFQWGWAESVFNFSAGPVAPWIPELLFAIVFGLSMDYEIFLLTSIREARELGHDNASAVSGGLGTTARIITAAAIIMTVVFASFVTQQELPVKMVGFALASAIALDATVVRLLIMPAVMTLLGEANWWMPARLARILPKSKHATHGPVAA